MMTLTIVLAEITAVLLAVVIVITVKALRRRRRDRDAVKTLVISIKANQPARIEKLAEMLKDSNHLSEDDALKKANELIKKQNKFYQDAIDLYFTRNNEVLSKLDNRLEDLLDQYQGLLKISTTDNAGVDTEAMGQLSKDIAALSKELEELRAENSELSTHLKAAERELDQLGREYVSAFNKPKVDKHKEDKSEKINTAEHDRAAGENTVITADSSKDYDGLNVVEDPIAIPTPDGEPTPKDSTNLDVDDELMPAPAMIDGKTIDKSDSNTSFKDESGDPSLFADLGLDELIGELPGQPASNGKSTGIK